MPANTARQVLLAKGAGKPVVIVGVTGHQNLGDRAATDWVRSTFDAQLHRVGATLGLSSLAVGADQIFVASLQAARLPFEVVVPCRHYEQTFGDDSARARYRELLASATRLHELPYEHPNEEAFFAAGKWIVARCELLFAVWNGLPARGVGGTGDVVGVAKASKRPWIHIDPVRRTVRDMP
jgi:hypothetical protein